MFYDHLGQEDGAAATSTTTVVRPRLTIFQRMFPSVFPPPVYPFYPASPACIPVQVPTTGVLGRNTNGQLTVDGQTYCRPHASPYPVYPAPIAHAFPAFPAPRIFY